MSLVAALLAVLGVGVVGLVLYVWRFRKKPRWLKRYHSAAAPVNVTTARPDVTRDTFRLRKMPKDVDYIIIGSGMGGLYCAGVLARAGFKVVVLEQHYVTGGCTHEFEDHGYSFDTGVHYVGNMKKYAVLIDAVSHPEFPVKWQQTGTEADGFTYDRIQLGDDEPFDLQTGVSRFIDNLVKKFPDEEAAIRKYVELCSRVNKQAEIHLLGKTWHPSTEKFMARFAAKDFTKYGLRTAQSVLDELTGNAHLKALLAGQFGDYGEAPENAAFFIHAGVAYHYMRQGGFYPVGGPQVISRSIAAFIESKGGRVFVRAPVKQVLVHEGRAVGVEMENGDKLQARRGVISNAGAVNTFSNLLSDADRRSVNVPVVPADASVNSLKPGISHMYFFIGLRGTSKELNLPSSNLWWLPCGADYDLNKMRRETLADPFHREKMLMFVGFPSAKDPTFNDRFPGKSTCVVITEIEPRWFAAWRGYKSGKRPADYKALKERFKARIMKQLLGSFPQLQDRVEYFDIASPLTNEFYLRRTDSYGMEPTPKRFQIGKGGCRCATGIKNLWLAGQDMSTAGFVGAMVGGGFAAGAVLGYNAFDAVALGRNVFEDLVFTYQHEQDAAKKAM